VIALAESGRMMRYLNIVFGAALFVTPFVYGVDLVHLMASLVAGAALIGLAFRKGPVRNRYGAWTKAIV
jgi:hypothetical protein